MGRTGYGLSTDNWQVVGSSPTLPIMYEKEKRMSRDIPYDPELQCDNCDTIGAYDFMGDYLCENCMDFHVEEEYVYDEDDEVDLWDYAG